MDVGLEDEAAYALVLQEVTAEAARQGVRSSKDAGDAGDISELFSESEADVGPEVETRAPRWACNGIFGI